MQDTINENRNLIDSVVNNEDFTDKINAAVPHKVRLDIDLKREIKEVQSMYVKQMIASDPSIQEILNKKRKDRDEDEQAKLGTFIKKASNEFNALKKIIYPVNDGDSARAAKALVSKVVAVAKMLKYVGRGDIEDAFAEAGFQLAVPDIEDENQYFQQDNVKEIVKDIFNQAEDVQSKVKENIDIIKNDIYGSLPESVRYDAKGNKKGIKASQFQKLVKQKAVILEKGNEAGAKFRNNQIKKTEEEIVAKQIELEKAQQI